MRFLCVLVMKFPLGVFDDDDVTHVEGDVNPIRDIEIIQEELRLKVDSPLCLQAILFCTVTIMTCVWCRMWSIYMVVWYVSDCYIELVTL